MKLIYSNDPSDVTEGAQNRNPDYFDGPEKGVEEVGVVGDYPKIVAAYEALEVPVVVKAVAAPEPITRKDIADMKKADVTELLEAHGASTDGNLPELRERLIATMFVDA